MIDDMREGMRKTGTIKVEWWTPTGRSMNQNSLFHVWCDELANSFTKRSKDGKVFGKDEMKVIVKHKFLGYDEIKIGNTDIPPQLKTTSNLEKGVMFEFMNNVERWASDCGVILSNPADSEYKKLKEYQHEV